MAVTRVASGTAVAAASSPLTPAYPAGVANARLALLKVTLKPDTGTINTPTGYLAFPGASGTGGTGAVGVDSGPMRAALFYRVLDGSETGTVSVTFTGLNNAFAVIDIYEATKGFDTAAFAGTVASEATSGTGWSATGAADLALTTGNLLVGFSGATSNASNNLTVGSRSVTATGATLGAVSSAALSLTNSGNDSAFDWWDAAVTAGTSSAAPTYTSTHSASNSGVTVFAKLVESPTVIGSATGLFGGVFKGSGDGIVGRTATLAENASTTTITGTLPADRETGDCVVAVFGMTSTVAGFTAPGGSWAELVAPFTVSGDRLLAAYYQFDPASGPVGTQSVAGRATCICQAYKSVDPSTPVDVAAVTQIAAATPITVGSITTATDGAKLIGACIADSASAVITCPGTMAEVAESTGSGRRTEVADEHRPTAGATGTRQWSLSAGALAMAAFTAALRPAVTSGPVIGVGTGSFGGGLTASGVARAVGSGTGSFGGSLAASGTPRRSGTATGLFGGTHTAAGVGRTYGRSSGNSFGFQALAAGLRVSDRVRSVDFNDAGDWAAFPTEEYVSAADGTTVTRTLAGGEGVISSTAVSTTANDRRLFLYDSAFQPANVDVLARFGRVVGSPGDTQRGFVARVKVADASLGQAPIHWTNVIFGADGHSITGVWEWPTTLDTLHTNQTGGNGLYSPPATVVGAAGRVTVTTAVPHLVQPSHIIQVVSAGLSLNVQVNGGITVLDDFSFSFANATTGTAAGYFQWLFTPTGSRSWMRMRLHSNVITTKYWMDGHPEPADGDTLRTTTTTLATTLLSGAALRTGGGRVGIVAAHMGDDSSILVDNFSAVDLAVRGAATGSFGGGFTASGTGRALGSGTGAFGGALTGQGVGRAVATGAGQFGGTLTAAGVARHRGVADGSFGGTLAGAGVGRAVGSGTGQFGGSLTGVGVRRRTGVAAGSFGFAATSVGVGRAYGAATGLFGFEGTAVGSIQGVATGAGTGLFGFAAVALAAPRRPGTATAAFGGSLTAVAVGVARGAATGAFGGTLTASGVGVTPATAAGVWGFTSAATGVRRPRGAAAANFGFAGAAAGSAQGITEGSAVGAFGFTAAATAVVVTYGTAVGALGFVAVALGRLVNPPGSTTVATPGATRRPHTPGRIEPPYTTGGTRTPATAGTTRRTP